MTVQQLDLARSTKPFRPFTIHMADGRSFPVPYPEFLSRSPTGRTVIVYAADDTWGLLDLLLVTELKFNPPVASSGDVAA